MAQEQRSLPRSAARSALPSVTAAPNPASNSKLADLIAKAKRMSVPNDNIQRIIKKAEGGDKTEFEAITYEGYGPGGVAVMVETLTDNRNRTAADLRHYFDKNGGNLGAMGCVGFLFSQKGVIDISLEDKDADEAMMDALDAGAEDFDAGEEAAEITTDPENYSAVVKALEEKGYEIDEEGFHAEMTKQKERARAERLKKNISGWSEDLFGALDAEPTVFTGYETLNDTGVVVALSDEETLTDAIATDEEAKDGVLVVLDKTPFYAEMGGQAADHGVITGAECVLRVQDVKKTPKGYYVHTCTLESGIVHVGDHLTARVDKEYRMAIARNHTATHLLQAALREVLGDHVHQAGSYQDASITHFDFTHFSAVTPEELVRVQKIVNDKIFESMNVTVKEMPVEEAKKLGAMALFGEKYGKVVRVVDIEGWSTEFCGGTHVKNTAQIGGFKIVSESSVAAGIRRIEAVTGRNLLIRANMQEAMLHAVANTLKANNVTALPVRAEAVMAENKALAKELEEIKAQVAAFQGDQPV